MRIRPGSEYCHRHFTDFMLFFAPTIKLREKLTTTAHEQIDEQWTTWLLSREFENSFPSLLYWNGTWNCPGMGEVQKKGEIKRQCHLKKIRPLFPNPQKLSHFKVLERGMTTENYFNHKICQKSEVILFIRLLKYWFLPILFCPPLEKKISRHFVIK